VIERRPVDLAVLVAEAVADAAQGSGRDVRFDHDAGPLPVEGDAGRLRQLLDNLIGNAIKYSPGGEPVDVELRRDGPIAVLRVRDHGIGIDAGEVDRLFTEYARAATAREHEIPGVGLGLTICRAIAGAHEGTIELTSARGEGTTATVRLPAARG
jgi:signal transduction histidine kinase